MVATLVSERENGNGKEEKGGEREREVIATALAGLTLANTPPDPINNGHHVDTPTARAPREDGDDGTDDNCDIVRDDDDCHDDAPPTDKNDKQTDEVSTPGPREQEEGDAAGSSGDEPSLTSILTQRSTSPEPSSAHEDDAAPKPSVAEFSPLMTRSQKQRAASALSGQ